MFKYLQKIGKALMVPVAVLPAAAILMGIGYWIDPTGWGANSQVAALLITAGKSLIGSMGILFAVGVAFGMSKDQHGSAALTGLVGFLVLTTLLSPGAVAALKGIKVADVPAAFGKIDNGNQFIGILVGVISSALYNKFSKVELHKALSFFSGKRLVPIITAATMIPISFILMFLWPVVYNGLVTFGTSIVDLGPLGAGIYGFFNRLLIPVGLHHALNSVFWFGAAGINDLGNFWAGTGTKGITGMYMAGFFPIMMFGLVGAAAAFVKTSKPENKNKVASIMIAAGFATFFTGVTEPLEFAFMFLAPGLYLIHALLTGVSLFIAATMHWTAGFGFSAGLVDFILSSRLPLADKPYMLIVQGLVFMAIYYLVFTFAITKWNLKTPGREEIEGDTEEFEAPTTHTATAKLILEYVGGTENLMEVDSCATRLRLEVKDQGLVQDAKIKKITSGVLKPGKTSVQIIVGPHVEFVAAELKKLVK
ncbi:MULTISPECIES: N-acetylglucosamine-specific PTS transporter subunit IIBC [Psychrilyobacter]|uniref:PTS glucose transporter subunit IIBC n=1 Tax=Psychrilyobacter piezotolerans TaxID=2293438 RepID=A0ABX9KME2_9FUSO|nr:MULTISPECIES: N-acetylglucosamine-specific PTS transporter subunit IIBC [Psychrilyobacter]MCS5421505.1 N-acetylglucosamine-specific PTS transporter subunit IIBC [Psychrilyobacter sp. S5]NDI76519.1 PTS transporter subunit EIIC [Psychrilyobacter piezotolerans]RDE66110.1 PTS glucose transporter subunit IIBC [Psychrilyobacter sp. S5]REI43288.1 PTS glucose transporter subunit IIBC [Psychrilyobacter piezotolerans]